MKPGRTGLDQQGLERAHGRSRRRVREQRGQRAGRDGGVVVEQEHPLEATVQRGAQARVVAAREAQVGPVLDQLDPWMPRPDRVLGPVP